MPLLKIDVGIPFAGAFIVSHTGVPRGIVCSDTLGDNDIAHRCAFDHILTVLDSFAPGLTVFASATEHASRFEGIDGFISQLSAITLQFPYYAAIATTNKMDLIVLCFIAYTSASSRLLLRP